MGYGFRRIECLRSVILAAGLVVGSALPAVTQTAGGGAGPAVERREPTMIGGNPRPAPMLERCVEVEIGSDSALGCLNQKLKREVDRVNPSLNLPPLDARASDVRVGNVNEAAVRQQYGSNYGRSAVPFRPPAATYVLPRH